MELDRQGKPYTSLPPANPRGGKRVKKGTPANAIHLIRIAELSTAARPLVLQNASVRAIAPVVLTNVKNGGERKGALDALLNISNGYNRTVPSKG